MNITFLGHAGFCVESDGDVLIIDPWLSPNGAFDRAWFQFPRNHHLIEGLRALLTKRKKTAIYVTHDHEDHFCQSTLIALKDLVGEVIIPNYEIKALRDDLTALGFDVREVGDREKTCLGGLTLDVFVDESGINRDSAILVRDKAGRSFLNFNDCKIYDRTESIREKFGQVDVFTCQFSGATMHPICYDYEPAEYRSISRRKRLAKFVGVRTAIERLQPRFYLPSAGPCAFLDPTLFHLNFEADSVFPKTWEFADFLRKAHLSTEIGDLAPGDALRVGDKIEAIRGDATIVNAETFADYAAQYQRDVFSDVPPAPSAPSNAESWLAALIGSLRDKLESYAPYRDILPIRQVVYFAFEDTPDFVKVDFGRGDVCRVAEITEPEYYLHRTVLSRISRPVAGEQAWSSYALTFRFRNHRVPDVYDTLISLLFFSDRTEYEFGLRRIAEFKKGGQRLQVEAATGERYEVNRYCPHQGADLAFGRVEGSVLVCPRHHWRFDLQAGGKCVANQETICAISLPKDRP